MNELSLHRESPDAGNAHRVVVLEEIRQLLKQRQGVATTQRHEYFQPDLTSADAYESSLGKYRARLVDLLGWPLKGGPAQGTPQCREEFVAEDSLGRISRMWIEALPGLRLYGLFFRPRGDGPFPFVIAQHGGQGTPELASDFFGSCNYNDMVRRVLRRGYAVFAPQLMLWNTENYGPDHEWLAVDKGFKQVGGSMAAVQIFELKRALDYFSSREDIDAERMGMVGLSYGGFYTLFTAALDTRIKVAVSSCFFNDRTIYPYDDWVWFDAANHFTDPEVASMVCPRPLFIEVGQQDALFDVQYARPLVHEVADRYATLGLSGNFGYEEHSGTHEFNPGDGGVEFLCKHL
jgi:dienelactone hydrolase